MASSTCPTDPELLALILGNAVPEPVRRHVEACADCRLRADRLRAEMSAVRRVADELPDAAGPTAGLAVGDETASYPSTTESSGEGFEPTGSAEPQARPECIGRYRIVGELDHGGQADVYRAVHPTLPRDLAIKIAREPGGIDHSLLRADAELLCELDHPNLVRVFDLDVHDGRPFVAMEFVRGRNLQQVAEQAPPSPHQAAAWVAEIARALEFVHRRGVVHQDIKPGNIMLDESGRPRLIDFGMARWRHAWSGRRTGPSGGTLAFMAPEQARGEAQRVGEPSDIFALGGVLYFLLTGKSPFGGGTRQEQWSRASRCDFDRTRLRAAGIPRGMARIVLKAMAPEPEDRYASAAAMSAALDACALRPRRLALAAVILLLAALAVVAWSSWPRAVLDASNALRLDSRAHRAPIPAEPAPATQAPPLPLRIESFQAVLHHRQKPIGAIGFDCFVARYQDDDVRVQVRLNRPAYCFLIALNPDGVIQLCSPATPATAPSATDRLDYPEDPGQGFGLTDGVGLQVFVLVASTKPLSPYAEWSRQLGKLPWKPVDGADVWRYDGRSFDRDIQRGDVRRLDLADIPQPLEAACKAFKAGPGVEAIRALAFPVQAQQEAEKARQAD